MNQSRRADPRRLSALACLTLVVPCAHAFAEGSPNPQLDQPPAAPAWLRPRRDDTMNPVVLEAGRLLRDRLWRPTPPDATTHRDLGLPVNRLVNDDQGHITVIRGDNGELDVNWNDPNQLQEALLTVIQSFYNNHPGRNPHFITVMTTFPVDSLAAFYMPLANDVRGIGYQHAMRNEVFSSVPGIALDGIIFMNSFRNYSGVYAPLGRLTFNQELGHRWGSHVWFEDESGPSQYMLGRDCSHWSFFMHSENSSMEGNVWDDNGNRTFSTGTSFFEFGYSQLDRYLMGFAPAESITPWFLIDDAGAGRCDDAGSRGSPNPSHYPPIFGGAGQDQITVRGTRVDIGINDVIAVEGERDPSFEDSRKNWSMAFILAARENDSVTANSLDTVDDLRVLWERQWERDATQPGFDSPDLVTTADGSADPEPEQPPGPGPGGTRIGNPCGTFDDCDPSAADHCIGTNTGVSVCTSVCLADADCPEAFCCVPSQPGVRQDRYNWYCLERRSATCEDYSVGEAGGSGGEPPAGGSGGEPPAGGSGGEPSPGGQAEEPVTPPDAGVAVADVEPLVGSSVERKSPANSGCAQSGLVSSRSAMVLAFVPAVLLLRRRRR